MYQGKVNRVNREPHEPELGGTRTLINRHVANRTASFMSLAYHRLEVVDEKRDPSAALAMLGCFSTRRCCLRASSGLPRGRGKCSQDLIFARAASGHLAQHKLALRSKRAT